MGLFEQLLETYDNHADKVGEYEAGRVPLAPISHAVKTAEIEIVLDAKGTFVSASKVSKGKTKTEKNEAKIIIPVTEESANRSGKNARLYVHPLSDCIEFLTASDCKQKYLEQMEGWMNSPYAHPKLSAIYTYVQGGTLIDDLSKCGIINRETTNSEQKSTDNYKKQCVRWSVIGIGTGSGPCWTDKSLFNSFMNYYSSIYKGTGENICLVTGERRKIARLHPKGVSAIAGNAKLVSSNDKENFTYRGKYEEPWQAMTMGYEASQKVHNTLRWLIDNHGTVEGNRMFLCWSPERETVPLPDKPLFFMRNNEDTEQDIDYGKMLGAALVGYKASLRNAHVVIASFEALTKGRLALTSYSEFDADSYLEHLYKWDAECRWMYGKYEYSPSLKRLILCAFGYERSGTLEANDNLIKTQITRLMNIRLYGERIPDSLVKTLVKRASSPQNYSERKNYNNVLSTACAAVRKAHADKMEVMGMVLEPERKDRSYQFGRLLAAYDKIESEAMDKSGRITNAERYQTSYSTKPLTYARILDEKIKQAYLPKLSEPRRAYFRKLLGEIMDKCTECPEKQWNRPLDDTYLIGMYHQRQYFYTKKTTENKEDNNG